VSPDGRWALSVSGETGRPEVYLTSSPAHDWRTQVSIAGGLWPRWRADAREVYYTARDNKLTAAALTMRGTRLAVGATNPLFDVRPVGRGLFYAPSADGEKFLINTLHDASGAATLTFVQNWRVSLQP